MARINIDDDLYKQMGWFNLLLSLKSPDAALGALVRAWSIAQKYYFPERFPIPKDVWKNEMLSNELISAGFVMETEDGYIVLESEKQFGWLFAAREKGRKGGEKTAQNKAKSSTDKHKSSTAKAQPSTTKYKNTKDKQSLSTKKPLSPTLSPIPTLSPDISQNNTGEILDLKNAQEKSIEEIRAKLKELEVTITPDQVIQLFNSHLAGTGKLNYCRDLGGPSRKNMLDTFSAFKTLEDWEHLFKQVKESKQITGEEPGVFLATLDWLSIKENALKADAGKYKNNKPSNILSQGKYELSDNEIFELQEAGEI